jgi:hypothetical protein
VWRIGTSKNPESQGRHVHLDIERLVNVADQKRSETEFTCSVTKRLVLSGEGAGQSIAVNENELTGMLLSQFVTVVRKVLTFLVQHLLSGGSRTVTRNLLLVIHHGGRIASA